MKVLIFLVFAVLGLGVVSQAETLDIPRKSLSFDFSEVDQKIEKRNTKKFRTKLSVDDIEIDEVDDRSPSSIEDGELTKVAIESE